MKKTPIYIYTADNSVLAKLRYEREEQLNSKVKTISFAGFVRQLPIGLDLQHSLIPKLRDTL